MALLFVGGSKEVERVVASLLLLVFILLVLVDHVGELWAEEHGTQCFSEGN